MRPCITCWSSAVSDGIDAGAIDAVGIDGDEGLMQFLYRVPIGLVQMTPDGSIEMANPMSVQLLMPMAGDANLDNFFELFDGIAPQLRALSAAFEPAAGVVCQGVRVVLVGDGGRASSVLSIDLTRRETFDPNEGEASIFGISRCKN